MPGNGFKDLTGQRFGRLVVLERDFDYVYEHNITRKTDVYWACQCDCGNKKTVKGVLLRSGKTKSCGCLSREKSSQRFSKMNQQKAKDLTGQVFGELTVLYPLSERKHGAVVWHCKCSCGKEYDVRSDGLTSGKTKTCGCQKSIGEYKIEQILKENYINFEKQRGFSDLRSDKGGILRYDFYLPDCNRLIEFDGEQHYKSIKNIWSGKDTNFEDQQRRDKIKNEYALSHNIPLVRIPYWKRNNITLEIIMGDQYLIEND